MPCWENIKAKNCWLGAVSVLFDTGIANDSEFNVRILIYFFSPAYFKIRMQSKRKHISIEKNRMCECDHSIWDMCSPKQHNEWMRTGRKTRSGIHVITANVKLLCQCWNGLDIWIQNLILFYFELPEVFRRMAGACAHEDKTNLRSQFSDLVQIQNQNGIRAIKQ